MSEDNHLPLTRMVSIKNPVFWIFLGVCAVLYFYDKFIGIDRAGSAAYSVYGDCVFGVAFVALFLTIAAESVKNPGSPRVLNISCYIFEAVTVLVLGVLIFIG